MGLKVELFSDLKYGRTKETISSYYVVIWSKVNPDPSFVYLGLRCSKCPIFQMKGYDLRNLGAISSRSSNQLEAPLLITTFSVGEALICYCCCLAQGRPWLSRLTIKSISAMINPDFYVSVNQHQIIKSVFF